MQIDVPSASRNCPLASYGRQTAMPVILSVIRSGSPLIPERILHFCRTKHHFTMLKC
jgi:hypothetical protein